MRQFSALLLAIIITISSVFPCFAAGNTGQPAAAAEKENSGEARVYSYSTMEMDLYNFAHIYFSGSSIQVARRGYQLTEYPDDITVRFYNTPVVRQSAVWNTGVVEGVYYGYNATVDVSLLGNGEYTLTVESKASTTDSSVEGKTTIYSYPYTLATVRFVKQGNECYFPANQTVSSRYNSAMLRQLQEDAPDDFAVLTKAYDQEENKPVLEEIEAKAKQLTAGLYTDMDKSLAIYQWIVNNIAYDYDFPRDYTEEWLENHPDDSTRFDNPLSAFQSGYALCYGYAKLTTLMLGYAGVDSVYIKGLFETDVNAAVGDAVNPDEFNHAWNAVKIDGSWYYLDTCKDAVNGYYRTDSGNPHTGYVKMNKLLYYTYVFPSTEHISNTHIALRYGAEKYGKKLTGVELPG